MFEVFLKEFLSNFKDMAIINYEEAYLEHMANKEHDEDISSWSRSIKFKGRHLVYFNEEALFKRTGKIHFLVPKNRSTKHVRKTAQLNIEENYSKGLPLPVQYGASVILSVNYTNKTITVNKIKNSIFLRFTRFEYMEAFCIPNAKFKLPTNAEDFILRI